MIFKIEYVLNQAIENPPFKIDRPDGSFRYIFFHFASSVYIEIDNKVIKANPGACILFTPRTKQKFYVEDARLNHDYIDFTINNEEFLKDINFPLNTLFHPKLSPYISDIVKKIKEEKKVSEIGSKYMCDKLMCELLVTLSRKINHRNTINSERYTEELKGRFEKIRLNMYHIPDRISVNSLASEMGFSLSRFNELYKTFFSTTPIKDLTKARVSRVEELLESGYSTKEIIRKIGFSSEEYFYRWFKKHFHMTKDDYIKEKKQ